MVVRDAPVFLLPFDLSLLWAAYCMAKDDHISQDVLDEWCMALKRIPHQLQDKDYSSWSPSEALSYVKDWVMRKAPLVSSMDGFQVWQKQSHLQRRWRNATTDNHQELQFIIDMISVAFSDEAIDRICASLPLMPPKPPTDEPIMAKTNPPGAGTKKSKVKAEDLKGQKSIMNFFKKSATTST